MSEDDDMKLVKKFCDDLGEHFDTVRIFVTRHEPEMEDGTITIDRGVGNWYAQYGQVKEWMIIQDERAREHTRDGE